MKWKLVPVEPTEEIRSVIRNEPCVYQSEDELYAALIKAAPQPPKLSDERIDELIEEHAPDTKRRYCVDFARAIEREILVNKCKNIS